MLSNTILETCDCNIITFLDTTEYVNEPENPILRIYPPDFESYGQIEYNTNAITLIKPPHIKHGCLPGGLYTFIQSIKPNIKTEYSTCYLHVCNELERLKNLACCDEAEGVVDIYIELLIAQKMANDCPEKAVELYNISKDKIDKLEKLKNCNC